MGYAPLYRSTFLTIRATSAVPDKIIELVAQSSVPDGNFVIPPNQTPEQFISSICGVYTDTFANIFFALNAEIADDRKPQPTARSVKKMPACIRWWRDVPVKVNTGDTLDALLKREIGRRGSDVLACDRKTLSNRCNMSFRQLVASENPNVKDLDALSNIEQIVLPLVTRDTSFKIKRSLDAKQIQKQISELDQASGALITNAFLPSTRLLAKADLSPSNINCRDAGLVARKDGRAWPYDTDVIGKIILRTKEIAWKARTLRPSPTTVTLVDTGVDDTFPRELLKRTDRPKKGPWGFSVSDTPTSISPSANYEYGWHGTRVAQLLASASGLSVADLAELLKINVVNVVKDFGDSYDIDTAGLESAVVYAKDTEAKVINISIGAVDELPTILETIVDKHILVVNAAGNEMQEISEDKYPLYPALYGGKHPRGGHNVITVAGYDGALNMAEFSNWSAEFADLAAPACALVPGGGASNVLHGTSFAAPLVSLTAAIIFAFEPDPLYVKSRLQAAADIGDAMSLRVLWRGRLNIAKALSLYEDVIEERQSHKLVRGEMAMDTNEAGEVELCRDGRSYNPDRITKILSLRRDPPYSIIVQYSETAGLLTDDKPCEPKNTDFLFFVAEENLMQRVTWGNVSDFVKRHFFGYSPISGK
jgi:hypothetical protein